jgi:hypothetical protein
MIDIMELEERIFAAFYISNEMSRDMAKSYAMMAAKIAMDAFEGKPRVDYFNPKGVGLWS